ncbi:MAG TPA: hypothetical protein VG406_22310 [Isosphaeraceae bacterium]|jgi:hypothetical protein|nr:hypothetical protein [Isosphaeraceae bacterium]
MNPHPLMTQLPSVGQTVTLWTAAPGDSYPLAAEATVLRVRAGGRLDLQVRTIGGAVEIADVPFTAIPRARHWSRSVAAATSAEAATDAADREWARRRNNPCGPRRPL